MQRPKVIIFVTEDWAFVVHRMEFALYLKEQGYDVIVLTNVTDHGDVIRNAGCELIPLKLKRDGYNPLRELRSLLSVVRVYRRVKPDVIHQVALKPIVYGTFAAKLVTRAPVVNAVTGLGSVFIGGKKDSLFRRALKWTYAKALKYRNSWVVVQNQDDYNYMLNTFNVANEKLSLIRGSGVNLDKWHLQDPTKNTIPVVAYVGRLLKDKGIYELIQAIKILQEQGIAARFLLIGDEDLQNPTSIPATVVQNWVSQGLVEWLGYRQDMINLYGQIDIVVLPSYREGLPRSLLEASACGKAIVTTNVPGCTELIQHEKNGLLVAVRDPYSLAEGLQRAINNSDLRRQLGLQAREMVEKFHSNKVIFTEYLSLYGRLLSK